MLDLQGICFRAFSTSFARSFVRRNALVPAVPVAVLCLCALGVVDVRAQQGVDEGVWENYDFIPGDTVLFFEDFSAAYVGDFPADRLEFVDGSLEVVERGGDRMLRTENAGTFRIALPAGLPERFTVEFDVEATDERHELLFWTEDAARISPGSAKNVYGVVKPAGSGLSVGKYAPGPKATEETGDRTVGRRATVRLSAEGDYMKMYVDEKRVANVPRAPLVRSNGLYVRLSVYPHDDEVLYVDNLRVASGGRVRLYDRLMAEGFISTQAIYFDVNEATLRAESLPFLNEVARMLADHADVSLEIQGHTDTTGGDAVNIPLSQRRAEAVRDFLVARRGVAADRLTAVGRGASEPVADNAVPEGRAQNRRVVLKSVE